MEKMLYTTPEAEVLDLKLDGGLMNAQSMDPNAGEWD